MLDVEKHIGRGRDSVRTFSMDKKGVQTIVIVIIVIVVGAAATLVAGFMLGLFGTPAKTESLQIDADNSHLVQSSHVAIIVVRNTGTADAQIASVEIGDQPFTWPGGFTTPGNDNLVKPGFSEGINIMTGVNVVAGTQYLVKVNTQAGNTIQATITAE